MEACSMGGGSARSIVASAAAWLCGVLIVAQSPSRVDRLTIHAAPAQAPHFETSENCMACHNNLTTASGEDVSIGSSWRGSIMANSSRDPYWQASVRRETVD